MAKRAKHKRSHDYLKDLSPAVIEKALGLHPGQLELSNAWARARDLYGATPDSTPVQEDMVEDFELGGVYDSGEGRFKVLGFENRNFVRIGYLSGPLRGRFRITVPRLLLELTPRLVKDSHEVFTQDPKFPEPMSNLASPRPPRDKRPRGPWINVVQGGRMDGNSRRR